jgi:hypothetical protein
MSLLQLETGLPNRAHCEENLPAVTLAGVFSGSYNIFLDSSDTAVVTRKIANTPELALD